MDIMPIAPECIRAPYLPSQLRVVYDGRIFSVLDANQIPTPVLPMNLSEELRDISKENLEKFLKVGYLNLKQIGEHYALKFNGRVLGGGALGAALTYVGAMAVGGAMVAAGVVTAPVGGGVLIAAGSATITAAPFVAAVMLPTPTP